MSQNVVKIKSRIKSVSGAYKVTSAMKLVSTVKLKQWRNKMLANKEYNAQLNEAVDLLLLFTKDNKSSYLKITSYKIIHFPLSTISHAQNRGFEG